MEKTPISLKVALHRETAVLQQRRDSYRMASNSLNFIKELGQRKETPKDLTYRVEYRQFPIIPTSSGKKKIEALAERLTKQCLDLWILELTTTKLEIETNWESDKLRAIEALENCYISDPSGSNHAKSRKEAQQLIEQLKLQVM